MKVETNDPNDREMGDAHRAAYLIAGYVNHTLTDMERDELDEWVTASNENMELFAELTDEKNIEKGLRERSSYDADKAFERLKGKLKFTRKSKPKREIRYLPLSIAASLLLLAGIFFLYKYTKTGEKPTKIITEKPDLQPGGDKAVLTLSDGQKIILDTAKGNILQQGDLKVINLDGKISYEGKSNETTYHTLSTPKGGQYKVMLPDGTAVWLNAASSLKYPLAFADSERVVELTGEGYFEVASDPGKRFKVKLKNDALIEVTGTHFNIMAYDDEQYIQTTLLEGAVTLRSGTKSALMKPGEQSTIIEQGFIETRKIIDVDDIIAWKNGLFEFKKAPIEEIMRQVARWYDVNIIYEGSVNFHFNASIERGVPVSKLFYLLEQTDRVHFIIRDKTIIVKP